MRNQEARQITKKFVCPLHQEVSRKSTTVHPEIDRKSAYLRKPWKLQTALFAVSPPGDFQKVHHSPPRTCQIIRLPEETREITKKSVRPLHLEISGKSTTFHPEIARKSAYPGKPRKLPKKTARPLHQEISRKSTTVHPGIVRKCTYPRKRWK